MSFDDHYRGLKEQISNLRIHDHVCLAYDDREQQVTAIAQFLRVGLERGERCLYISDKNNSDFILRVLQDTGVDVESLVERGALVVVTPDAVYLRKGYFDPDDVIKLGRELVASSLSDGFSALRTAADMSWARGVQLSSQKVLDWEAKVSCLFNENIVSICQYNTNLFDRDLIEGVLNGHPVSINGGALTRNAASFGADSAELMIS